LALFFLFNNGKTLNEISDLFSGGAFTFEELDNWKIDASSCVIVKKSVNSFLSCLQSGVILTQLHANAGPDLVLRLSHVSESTQFAILYIQSKVKKAAPLNKHALKSLNPGNPLLRQILNI
jgi:hypothetical protein